MAQEERDYLRCRVTDERVAEAFDEFAEGFESESEAVRTAIKTGMDEYDPADEDARLLAATRVVTGAMVAVLVSAIGLSWSVAGPGAAAGLTALAMAGALLGTQLPVEGVV